MFTTPRIGLAAYCFALNFDSYSLLAGGGFSVPKFVAFAYFMSVVVGSNFSVRLGQYTKLFVAIISVFALITFSTFVHTDDVSIFLPKLMAMFLNAIMFWVLLKHSQLDPGAIHVGILAFTAGGIMTSILMLAGYGIETNEEGRVTMFGDNENLFGIKLAVACIVSCTLGLEGRYRFFGWQWILLAVSVLPAIGVLKSGSRVATISLVLALFIMLFNLKALSWKKMAIIALIIGAAPFLYAYLETTPAFERLERTYQTGDTAGRNEIWEDLTPAMWVSPVIGSGFPGLSTRFGEYTSPHNVLIEVLITSGVVGLACFLFYCWHIFRAGWLSFFVLRISLPAILLIPFLGALLSAQVLDTKLYYLLHVYALSTVFQVGSYPSQTYDLPTGQNSIYRGY